MKKRTIAPLAWLFHAWLFYALSVHAQQTPQQAAHHFKAAAGLEVKLWAAEPMLENPTNIDIDERGRIWVLEGVNYRRQLNHLKDYRPNGDRILILEDTDGDGKADKVTVFDENPALRSPLGIAVLGNKVIISQSPDVIVYTKDDQDKILKKELLLTGWRGVDHDHGVHAVVFGPDGRYYLNNGDPGFDITDKSGKHLISARSGPYYAGCALRVNPDGTNLTVIGHDFRNPYELALDSFGNIWQSDNDDDGNAWTRLNYVFEGGNYGYWGPGGRRWQEDKGTHFHNELPGVVPNIARLGAGAPCGIVVYEGKLLPKKYWGQLLHAEAGKRVINAYFLEKEGAGYTEQTEETVTSPDGWFRPSDVAVGPDGSVFFADWYDPVVGGHQMKDTARGRIYRLAPAGFKPATPKIDLETSEGLAEALRSPAQSVRYLAWTKLHEQGQAALPALMSMWKQDDPILRARALWLLGGLQQGAAPVAEALHSPDPNFRMLALRVLRLYGADMVTASQPLLRDPSAQVRREIAISLQDANSDPADSVVELSKQYDGQDRWYLEALGIASSGRENAIYGKLRAAFGEKWDSRFGQLIWEYRPSDALPYLISNLGDQSLTVGKRGEALDALAAMRSADAGRAVTAFLNHDSEPPELIKKGFDHLSHQLFSEWIGLRQDTAVQTAVRHALASADLQAQALGLADDLGDPAYAPQLSTLANSRSVADELRMTAVEALGRTRDQQYLATLEKLSRTGPVPIRVAAMKGLGDMAPPDIDVRLKKVILSQDPNEVRSAAVHVLGRTKPGLNTLLDLQQQEQLPAELKNLATSVVNSSKDPEIRKRAQKLLPPLVTSNKEPLPAIQELVWRQGEAERGRKLFTAETGPKCSGCHSVGGKKKVGPDLSNIGTKLGKDGLFEAILHPSAGIAPEYYLWVLDTKTQGDVIGIITDDTPQRVVVKTDATAEVRLKPSDIKSRRRSHLSLMPEDLMNYMTEQQLVDVVKYLSTLKEDRRASR
jgi:putative membrane-bound dehydrogenase-like protein